MKESRNFKKKWLFRRINVGASVSKSVESFKERAKHYIRNIKDPRYWHIFLSFE